MVKTTEALKAAITPERIGLALALCAAKANVQTIKPVVLAYQRAILARRQWHKAPQYIALGAADSIITEPAQAYLLDEETFIVYDAECDAAAKGAGFKIPPGCCPLLTAEHEEVKARQDLFSAFEPVTGIDPASIYKDEHRQDYERLLLGLCLSDQQ